MFLNERLGLCDKVISLFKDILIYRGDLFKCSFYVIKFLHSTAENTFNLCVADLFNQTRQLFKYYMLDLFQVSVEYGFHPLQLHYVSLPLWLPLMRQELCSFDGHLTWLSILFIPLEIL